MWQIADRSHHLARDLTVVFQELDVCKHIVQDILNIIIPRISQIVQTIVPVVPVCHEDEHAQRCDDGQ